MLASLITIWAFQTPVKCYVVLAQYRNYLHLVWEQFAENLIMGKKKSSIGCLFWIALILLVLVIFLFNRKSIESVLDKTGLLDLITRQQGDGSPEVVRLPDENDIEEVKTPPIEPDPPQISEEPQEEPDLPRIVVEEPETQDENTSIEAERLEKLRRSVLYFVNVDGQGNISLEGVPRPVYYIDSPLTDTLKALLEGLTAEEISDGLLSLVPLGTQIQGVSISDGTAYIDFNESFRFNSFGKEGYRSQLQQIVYTATEFQTVRHVQILVNGNLVSYLGPESPYIGEPLNRESL